MEKVSVNSMIYELLLFESLLEEHTSKKVMKNYKEMYDIIVNLTTFEKTLRYYREIIEKDLIYYDNCDVDLTEIPKEKIKNDFLKTCDNLENKYLTKLEKAIKRAKK